MPKQIDKKLFERDVVCTIICGDGLTLTGFVRLPMDNYVAICIDPHDMELKIRYETISFVVSFGHRQEIVLKD